MRSSLIQLSAALCVGIHMGGSTLAAAVSAGRDERVIVPAGSAGGARWRHTFEQPGAQWMAPTYDDAAWALGAAPFGRGRGTPWKTPDIWLRSEIELASESLPRNPHLVLTHDEDVWVYVNGQLVSHRPGFTAKAVRIPVRAEPFRAGRNVIAVRCHQTTGGQCIDVGVVDRPGSRTTTGTATVRADFSQRTGPDLVKDKFCVYNCPYITIDRWLRDVHLLDELRCSSFRYDPTWGGHNVGVDLNSPQISGTPDNLLYNFRDFDRMTDSLLQRHIEPMYVLAYTPAPLQRTPGVWADKPSNMDAWQRLCRDFAAHWRTTGRRIGYFEIWNEPDNQPFFFKGSIQDYLDIYRHAAVGVRQGDPKARVGGPAIAALSEDTSWLRSLLDCVTSNSLPLDFLSVHNYGDPGPTLECARRVLRRYPALKNVELLLTEYNSGVPLTTDFLEGGMAETHHAAARLLHDFAFLLEQRDVPKVYWAMFNDPDTQEHCGLVSLDGHRKASFNAFRIFAEMPVKRCAVTADTTGVEAMASCDNERAAIVAWNLSSAGQETTITLGNLPFRRGSLCVQRIDARHASYYDDPSSEKLECAQKSLRVDGSAAEWQGTIPAGGVVYLELRTERQ